MLEDMEHVGSQNKSVLFHAFPHCVTYGILVVSLAHDHSHIHTHTHTHTHAHTHTHTHAHTHTHSYCCRYTCIFRLFTSKHNTKHQFCIQWLALSSVTCNSFHNVCSYLVMKKVYRFIGASLSEPQRMVVFTGSTVWPLPKIYVVNPETPHW